MPPLFRALDSRIWRPAGHPEALCQYTCLECGRHMATWASFQAHRRESALRPCADHQIRARLSRVFALADLGQGAA